MPVRVSPEPSLQEIIERIEILEKEQQSVAIAYRNAIQKIPSTVITQIKLDKAIKDPGGNLNTAEGFYIAPSEGYYHIDGQVLLKTNIAEYDVIGLVLVNGIERVRGVQQEKLGGTATGCLISGIVFCNKGDKIELAIYQSSGVEKELEILEAANRLSVTLIGEGPAGSTGPLGEKGEKGATGEKGEKGATGEKGAGFSQAELEALFVTLGNPAEQTITKKKVFTGGVNISGGGGLAANIITGLELLEILGNPGVVTPRRIQAFKEGTREFGAGAIAITTAEDLFLNLKPTAEGAEITRVQFASAAPKEGELLFIWNSSANKLTIIHETAEAGSGKFALVGLANFVMAPKAVKLFIYTGRWRDFS